MLIEPSTNIRLLKGVPLDPSYERTVYYAPSEKAIQTSDFMSYTKHNLTNQMYQRVHKGVARVGLKAEDVYDCNYMMFQNTAFGDKWFYAFITRVEYVNNTVCEISFEIDVLQTWHFDYELKECFVEREHSSSDIAGDNLVPENLETGEYIATPVGDNTSAVDGTGKLGAYKIAIASTIDEEGYNITGGTYAGIYSGLYINTFDDYKDANAWLNDVVSKTKADGIVSVFMCPSAFVTGINEPVKDYTISKQKRLNAIDGYVPRNKKLLTYPYNFLYVTNLEGDSAIFPYEYFSTNDCQFTLAGDFSCNPGVILYPRNYKGVTTNFDEKLSISNFPTCAWNTDSFKAWLAQKGVSTAVGGTLGIAGGMGTMMTIVNPYVGAVVGGLAIANSIANSVTQVYEHAIMPNQAKGSTNSYTQAALRMKDFAFMHKHIRREFAIIIDSYFDLYGYACRRVKRPYRHVRKYWTYVQTKGCVIKGSVPADDMKKIVSIYDKGITFWSHNTDKDVIGNYEMAYREANYILSATESYY